MENIAQILARIQAKAAQASSINSSQPKPYSCEACEDTGWTVAVGEGAKRCSCLSNQILARALARIPTIYRGVTLATAKGDKKRHAKQAALIAEMKANPENSFLLFGRNGCGKSLFGWMLYRHAVESGRYAVGVLLADLLLQFRNWERDADKLPLITPADLRTDKRRYLIFLDELEKARPSEYAAEMLFQVLDAVYSFGHQLVVTSNLTPDALRSHWSENGETYGPSILRRIMEHDGAAYVDMF